MTLIFKVIDALSQNHSELNDKEFCFYCIRLMFHKASLSVRKTADFSEISLVGDPQTFKTIFLLNY